MFGFIKKDKIKEVEITISNRTVVRIIVLIILSGMFVLALKQAAYILSLIFTAFFLTLALNGPVHWIAGHLPGKRKGSRTLATGVSFLFIVLILGGFLASIVPPLVGQTTSFIKDAPRLVEDLRSENSSVGKFIRRNNLENQLDKLSDELSNKLENFDDTAIAMLTKITSSIFATLTVLVLTFMMLVEGPRWLGLFIRLVPKENREHVSELTKDMYKVVRGYVNGQVFLAALAAVLILVPLFLLNVGYPIALMVIVFICGLIPMVGHYLGAATVTLVALFTSPWAALIVLGYYTLYQQIENYVIQPNIQANSTNMSPLLVFSSVLIGVSFGGLLGGLVAIPVAGCLRILVLDYLKSRKYLEEKAEKVSSGKEISQA